MYFSCITSTNTYISSVLPQQTRSYILYYPNKHVHISVSPQQTRAHLRISPTNTLIYLALPRQIRAFLLYYINKYIRILCITPTNTYIYPVLPQQTRIVRQPSPLFCSNLDLEYIVFFFAEYCCRDPPLKESRGCGCVILGQF